MDNEPVVGSDLPGPFTESGQCDDEVILEFDCDKKLYVSRNFLGYASPVFKAMFNNDFIEMKENCVQLTEMIFEDFTEFLLCIHPGKLKSVTESNVLRIAPIAEKYLVTSITEKCKECMEALLTSSVELAKSQTHYEYNVEPLRVCFRILATAIKLNYDEIVDAGVKAIAKFGHINYNRNQPRPCFKYPRYPPPSPETKVKAETLGEITENCKKLFDQLPIEIRCRIYSQRLMFFDDPSVK